MEAIVIGNQSLSADERKILRDVLKARGSQKRIKEMTGIHQDTLKKALEGKRLHDRTRETLLRVVIGPRMQSGC